MNKVFISISLISILMIGCDQKKAKPDQQHHKEASIQKYTCPMHPQVIADKPGICPICGMDLVKISDSNGTGTTLMLSDRQVSLANIVTQKASVKPMAQTRVVNARVVANEELSEIISSRATGRVEKLFFKETGRTVKQGEPLYELYSETLLTLQQEFLLANTQYEAFGKTMRYQSFLTSAEKKLLLYGLTQKQIDHLKGTGVQQPYVTFLAPASGIITAVNVSEGQYVNEGTPLYRLENLTQLWVDAELYPDEATLVKAGDRVSVRIDGYESSPIEAKVIFLSPEYGANTQVMVMRAAFDNTDLKFKPGTEAQVSFTHSARNALSIPVDAVIRDGEGMHVYVEITNNTFQPRMIKTGIENFEQVEITDGLMVDELVVVSGAYLLYSELILKHGTNPMAGHQH